MKAIAVYPVFLVWPYAGFGAAARSRRRHPAFPDRFGAAARRAHDNPRFPRGSEVRAP
jgi:hypothetical protein